MVKIITDIRPNEYHEKDVKNEVQVLQNEGFNVKDIKKIKRMPFNLIFGHNETHIYYEKQ
jgi:hypothetical protein